MPFFTRVSEGKPLRRLLITSKARLIFMDVFVCHTSSWLVLRLNSAVTRLRRKSDGQGNAVELLLSEAALPLSYAGIWSRRLDSNQQPTITHNFGPSENHTPSICSNATYSLIQHRGFFSIGRCDFRHSRREIGFISHKRPDSGCT